MKKYILLLLLTGFKLVPGFFAQNKNIDSLHRLLQHKIKDSTRTLVLARLSREYLYFKADTSLLLAQEGLALARKIHFATGEARCLNSMANSISQTGNNSKALELFLQALKISENSNDFQTMCMVLANIGIIYDSQGDYKKSLGYYFQSKEISITINSNYSLTLNLINIGTCYEKLNQLDSARFYINQAYELVLKDKTPELLSAILISLGNIYSKMQQPGIAIANYRQGMPYALAANYNEGVCEASLGISRLFLQQGQKDSSLYYAQISFVVAQTNGFIQWVINSSNFLADYYKQGHLVDSAYTYLTMLIDAKDSMFSQEKSRQIQNLAFNEAIRQQEIATIKIAEEKERSDNIQYAFVMIGLIVFVVIFLLLTRSKIINEKWIRFLGVLGLLLLFEFINLLLHPYISKITHHSPLFMLCLMVSIASLLIPQHHRIEKWLIHKMVTKNKSLRLAAANKTIATPESEIHDSDK